MKSIVLATLLLTSYTLQAQEQKLTGEHKLSAENTTIKFVGSKKDGQHAGSFGKVEGTLTSDADLAKSKLSVTIDIDSLTSDDAKLTGHLKSPDFFDAKRFPTAKFVSTAIKAGADKDSYSITGDLTMLGKTHPVTFPAKATTADGVTTIAGDCAIKRSNWGMNYGPDKVNDEVKLSLAVKLKAAK
jgi:polyisoprenoid-binding protein YceI